MLNSKSHIDLIFAQLLAVYISVLLGWFISLITYFKYEEMWHHT